MMRRLKSIASGRSSVSDPVRARPPSPPPTVIHGLGTRIGCLVMLCECLVSFLWLSSNRPLQHQRGSFRSFACRGCLIFEMPCTADCLIWWQGFILLWSIWHWAPCALKAILFVSAEVFISPVGLIDAVLTVMC